jgi:hypothetical protein
MARFVSTFILALVALTGITVMVSFSAVHFFLGGLRDRSLVAVMIENHEDARPYQEGLPEALLIEEFLVEGQISRFAAVYDIRDLPSRIGPVRSLRPYFIDGLLPLVRTILFAGGSDEALARVRGDGHFRGFNGLAYPEHFLRDEGIPPPHNLFLPQGKLRALLTEDPKTVRWPPYRIGAAPPGQPATEIRINFFNKQHDVLYRYNRFSSAYIRENGTVESPATPRNVLLLEMPVESVGELGRLTIHVAGKGRALLFRSGTIQEGFWKKTGPDHPFVFENADGEELRFTKGQTWMTVLPTLDRVRWD